MAIKQMSVAMMVLVCAASAVAQHGGPGVTPGPANPITKRPAQPSQSPADPLSGPRVAPAAAGPSIVERDFEGRLRFPEVRPEEAALAKLDLTPEEKGATQGILAERAAMFDALVRENLDLLIKGMSVRESGDVEAMAGVLQEYNTALRPIVARGQLADQLEKALPAPKGEQLQSMMREYWRAVYDDANAGAEDTVSPQRNLPGHVGPRGRHTMHGVLTQEAIRLLGTEVKAAYDRLARQGSQQLEETIKALDLSPEQEGKVRSLVTDYVQESKLNPTPAQQAALFRKVMAELTPDQRAKMMELVAGPRSGM